LLTYSYCLFGVRNLDSSSAGVLNLEVWLPPKEKKYQAAGGSEANPLRHRAARRVSAPPRSERVSCVYEPAFGLQAHGSVSDRTAVAPRTNRARAGRTAGVGDWPLTRGLHTEIHAVSRTPHCLEVTPRHLGGVGVAVALIGAVQRGRCLAADAAYRQRRTAARPHRAGRPSRSFRTSLPGRSFIRSTRLHIANATGRF
jgi:hypothetical protein